MGYGHRPPVDQCAAAAASPPLQQLWARDHRAHLCHSRHHVPLNHPTTAPDPTPSGTPNEDQGHPRTAQGRPETPFSRSHAPLPRGRCQPAGMSWPLRTPATNPIRVVLHHSQYHRTDPGRAGRPGSRPLFLAPHPGFGSARRPRFPVAGSG